MFDHLDKVKEGDRITIDVFGETLTYEVDQIKVVLPDQISDLTPVQGQDLITLVTCTPYGINTHRLLVRAHRVTVDPGTATAPTAPAVSGLVMEKWMWWLLGGALAGLLVAVAIALNMVRSRRRQRRRARAANLCN